MAPRLRWIAARLAAAVLGIGFLAASGAAAEVPFLSGRVVDEAGVLDPAVRERVEAVLRAHEERTSDQVVVLTVASLEGESVEAYAERVFNTWKLGRADKDNGVLVLVSTGDRRMRIEVGYGLEGALTDGAAGSIIRNVMAPRFKGGAYGAGIEEGVAAILGVLAGNADAIPGDPPRASGGAGGLEAPEMPWYQRVLLGAFIFGVIGLFTVMGVLTPGVGWFLYVFLIPFWAMFPIIIVGSKGAFALLCTYLVAYPLVKLWLRRKPWYLKAAADLKRTGRATIGGVTIASGGSSGGGSSGGGFSGGGGSSGGGGASGGW